MSYPQLKVINSKVYAIKENPKLGWFNTGIKIQDYYKGKNYYSSEIQGTSLRINVIDDKIKIFMVPQYDISKFLKYIKFFGIKLWRILDKKEVEKKHYNEKSTLTHSKFIKEYKIKKLHKYVEKHNNNFYLPTVLMEMENNEFVYLEHYKYYYYNDGYYILPQNYYKYYMIEIKFELLKNDKIIYFNSSNLNCPYPFINSKFAYYFLFDKKYILKEDLKKEKIKIIETGNVYTYLYKYKYLAKDYEYTFTKYNN